MDGDFPVGDPEPEVCVICKENTTTRRIDMGKPGTGPEGPFKPEPVCTDCLAPCVELGDDRCSDYLCLCQIPDSLMIELRK